MKAFQTGRYTVAFITSVTCGCISVSRALNLVLFSYCFADNRLKGSHIVLDGFDLSLEV